MQNVSWIFRRINKVRFPPASYWKSYVVVIMIIAFSILTIVIYRHSAGSIIKWTQKKQHRFHCHNKWKLSYGKRFYRVDCTNPFLKSLVKSTANTGKGDVCNSFNPLYANIATMIQSFQNFQLKDFNELLQACPECHHLQVIDGKLYVVPRSTSTNYESRCQSVKSQFKYVIDTFDDIPNMEFLFHIGDSVGMKRNLTNPSKCPVFGFANNRNSIINNTYTDGVLSIPCFSFWNWPEAGITRWDKKLSSIPKVGMKKSFARKKSKVFWRGARTGRRVDFLNITNKHQQIMDVSFMDWGRSRGYFKSSRHQQYRTLEQHCDYKYLLHLEGNTFSGRLKYLLLCGSPVLFLKLDGWEEFWYHLLKHQDNIIIIDSFNEALLLNMTNYLFDNSERAARIGINGRNMILKYLNEQAIICYMRNVLLAYSKLIDYQVKKHVQATEKLI